MSGWIKEKIKFVPIKDIDKVKLNKNELDELDIKAVEKRRLKPIDEVYKYNCELMELVPSMTEQDAITYTKNLYKYAFIRDFVAEKYMNAWARNNITTTEEEFLEKIFIENKDHPKVIQYLNAISSGENVLTKPEGLDPFETHMVNAAKASIEKRIKDESNIDNEL